MGGIIAEKTPVIARSEATKQSPENRTKTINSPDFQIGEKRNLKNPALAEQKN